MPSISVAIDLKFAPPFGREPNALLTRQIIAGAIYNTLDNATCRYLAGQKMPSHLAQLIDDKKIGSRRGFEPRTFRLTAEEPTSSELAGADNKVPFPKPKYYQPKRYALLVRMLTEIDKLRQARLGQREHSSGPEPWHGTGGYDASMEHQGRAVTQSDSQWENRYEQARVSCGWCVKDRHARLPRRISKIVVPLAMDPGVTITGRRTARRAVILVGCLALVYFVVGASFIHQHYSGRETACTICQALHLPAVATATFCLLPESLAVSWHASLPPRTAPHAAFGRLHTSRAPPVL